MEGVQELHFSWNEHKDFLTKALKQQRDSEQYCDISLVSNDGFVVRAHQAVLAAASGWFLRVLGRHAHSHPTVVLDTVSLVLLKAIINYIYFGTIQIEKSLLSDLLEVADCLDLKGLCRIRKNSGINKFLPSNSTKSEQESCSSQSARSSPISRDNAVRSSVPVSMNSGSSENCTVNSCSSAFLFEETPSGPPEESFPSKLSSSQSDGQSRCSTSLQGAFTSQSKSGDSLAGQISQPFLPCTSGVHASVSASLIDSPTLHCNSSFTPSSAPYFNQTTLPLYNNRPPLMVMHQQAQHQQFSSQHQPQPSLQLYNPGASLNPCHSKQSFDSRMVGSAIDYQHPSQQHSLDDFRAQSLSNKSGIKSSPGLPQKLCYHQQPGIDSLPLQQNLGNPHQNSQLCLQLQQPEQLELQPDRHNYPYGQSAAHIPYSSPLLSGACNPHDNSQSNQLLSLQHQQQSQAGSSYIYGSECSAALDLPGLSAKAPGMHFLRGSNSGCSTMGYQTTGIDLSLTKSEPSSPRDYTASGPAATVAVDSLSCAPAKRKRGDEVSHNGGGDSDEEDGDDEEEEEGCVELVDGESCEDAIEGQCALSKKFRAASATDQTTAAIGRSSASAGGAAGVTDTGTASGLPPSQQPEGLPALDVADIKQSAYSRIDWSSGGEVVSSSVTSSAPSSFRVSCHVNKTTSTVSRSSTPGRSQNDKETSSMLSSLASAGDVKDSVSVSPSVKVAPSISVSLSSNVKLDESSESLSASPDASSAIPSFISSANDSQTVQALTYTFSSILSNSPSITPSLSKTASVGSSLNSISQPSQLSTFSTPIDELADRNTCSPLINIVGGGACVTEEKQLAASSADGIVVSSTTVSVSNSAPTTNVASASAASEASDVQLFGPDGPVSISFVQESVADIPVTHKKLDFFSSGNDSVTINGNSSVITKDGLPKSFFKVSNSPRENNNEKKFNSEIKDSSSVACGDETTDEIDPDVVAGSSSSSASEDSESKSQISFHISRSKSTRRLKRKAKMKRVEERRKWLAREKKLLFSGLKSNRPLTRSLDKLKNGNGTFRNKNSDVCSDGLVANDDTLGDLQVDCDTLNVDTVECVQVSVSDVDCADGSKNIDVGTNSDLNDLTTFGRSGIDKENRLICADANVATSVVKQNTEEFCNKNSVKPCREKTPSISPLVLYSMPPYKEKEKQTRTTLALQEKVKVIEAFLDGKSQRQIAQLYNIGKTQVSGIIKRREEILSLYRNNLIRGDKLTAKRQRKSEYALLNEHLIKWYRHMAVGTKITTGMLRAKALQIAPQLGYHDFKASNGWLATFKGNNNLKFSRAVSNSSNSGGGGGETNGSNTTHASYHNNTKGEIGDRPNTNAMTDETSYFEEADVETNTTEEEDPNPMLGSEGATGGIMDPVGVGGGSLMGRVVGGPAGESLPPSGGPCSGGFLTSPGLLQGAAAAILKCGVSVAGQTASNLPPQLPMEAFHLSRSAGAMDHNSPAAHHHPHHHHHHHHPTAAGPPSLALAAASKGDQSAAAAAAAAAGVLGYKSEEPLSYGGYDHHHHHQLQARMAPDQLAPQLAGRAAMAGDQLTGRMGDGGGSASSVATAAAASSSAAAAAVAAAARTSEYNYAPYTFPSGYYGYHFLGQY
ncbi:BTB/POZ domain [Trinorchestia longiramus]|nr:BTB/POZ domain [Trinorchestia longiramus]